ncbi:LysR family transcriptional regulator [Archangium violaceum]|uniref:LysR family transcriptional regulator n=1 Tax=Archangium violaceum TaxID=83451 RepID=UPI0036D93258
MQYCVAHMQATSWDDLRFFLAVARHGTLATAARELGVNASTAGRRIQALEKSLRVRLFLRTREGLRPSAAGEQLRQRLAKLEPELSRLVGGALTPAEAVAGTVRIATTEALAAYLVDRGLCALKEEHPGLVLELLGGNRPVDLARGEADMAIRVTKPEGASLKVRQLQAQAFGVYGAPGYLRQRGRPRSERELNGHDLVVVGGELGALPEARWMEKQQGARIVLRTNSMPALMAAVRKGLGLAVLPAGWAQVETELERLFDVPELPRRPMWLVIQPEAWERAAVRVVAARLRELLDPG